MAFLKQKINWKAIFGQIGLLLHVPGGMALISIGICCIFKEWHAIFPFAVIGIVSIGLGQLLYHLSLKGKAAHLWDAMIIAALGWLFCSIIAAIPFCWISQLELSRGVESDVLKIFSHPINALFEAFSGFTSTGLTMLQQEGYFPYVLQWWRSFLQWIGGLGLVVFVLALTHLNKQGYQLYYAEARSDQISSDITQTAHWIWSIYLSYTILAFLLFLATGLTLWEAINHAMTGIATGGFTLSHSNFRGHAFPIQIAAMFIMVIGAMSFLVHFQVIRHHHWKMLWKNKQQRLLYFFVVGGGILILLLHFWNPTINSIIPPIFEWVSALTTCGFNSQPLSFFSPMVKLMLIIGMFVGGSIGSTAGGFKIQRVIHLFNGVLLRLISITQKKEKNIVGEYHPSKKPPEQEPSGTVLPHSSQSGRLFTAEVLFFLWISFLLIGWFFILKWTPNEGALDALFDVTSAMSNVGLSSGFISPNLPSFGKCIFMFMMWIGRLEIIPALVLFLTLPTMLKRNGSNGKKS